MGFNYDKSNIQCRACMCKKIRFQKFHLITDIEVGMKVYEIFKYITPELVVQESDGLPQYICVGCLFKLKHAYQFQQMCIESDKKYRGTVKIKEEVKDVSDTLDAVAIKTTSSGDEASTSTMPQIFVLEQSNIGSINNSTDIKPIFVEQSKTTLIASKKVTLTDQYLKGTFQDSDPLEHKEAEFTKNETHICIQCKKAFKSRRLLLAHRRLHTDETPFLCPTCGKAFKNTANLRQHVLRHSENPRHQCPHCPRKFPCKSGVIKHQSIHSNAKNHVCEVCGSAFKRSYSLRSHMKIHTGKRPYKCEQCPAAFITVDRLRRHMFTHTGEKPYKCEYCSRAFGQSNDLYKHLRIHLGEKVFICTICKKAFKYFAELQEHKLNHQVEIEKTSETPETSQSDMPEDIMKEETIRSHKCEQCPAAFISGYHLRRHILTHTGEKPYKCEYCSRGFAQSNDLYKHLRIHLGEKVFICTICKEAFKYFAELQEHVLKHQVETEKTSEITESSQSELLEDIIIKEETILST